MIQKSFTSIAPDFFPDLKESVFYSESAPQLGLAAELRGAMSIAIRQSGEGREKVVDRMNFCLPPEEKKVTMRMLNAWMAVSKEDHRIPACYLSAFCWATQSLLPMQAMLQPLGLDIMNEQEKLLIQLARASMNKAQNTKLEKQLKKILGAIHDK